VAQRIVHHVDIHGSARAYATTSGWDAR
jgi:hypothetical protein